MDEGFSFFYSSVWFPLSISIFGVRCCIHSFSDRKNERKDFYSLLSEEFASFGALMPDIKARRKRILWTSKHNERILWERRTATKTPVESIHLHCFFSSLSFFFRNKLYIYIHIFVYLLDPSHSYMIIMHYIFLLWQQVSVSISIRFRFISFFKFSILFRDDAKI